MILEEFDELSVESASTLLAEFITWERVRDEVGKVRSLNARIISYRWHDNHKKCLYNFFGRKANFRTMWCEESLSYKYIVLYSWLLCIAIQIFCIYNKHNTHWITWVESSNIYVVFFLYTWEQYSIPFSKHCKQQLKILTNLLCFTPLAPVIYFRFVWIKVETDISHMNFIILLQFFAPVNFEIKRFINIFAWNELNHIFLLRTRSLQFIIHDGFVKC